MLLELVAFRVRKLTDDVPLSSHPCSCLFVIHQRDPHRSKRNSAWQRPVPAHGNRSALSRRSAGGSGSGRAACAVAFIDPYSDSRAFNVSSSNSLSPPVASLVIHFFTLSS